MNRGKDEFRVTRMREQMEIAGLDFLVLRLAENVLYTTGYWPIFGASAAIFPRDGEPSILFVEGEQEFVADTWVEDIEPYMFFTLEALAKPQRDGVGVILGDARADPGTGRIARRAALRQVIAARLEACAVRHTRSGTTEARGAAGHQHPVGRHGRTALSAELVSNWYACPAARALHD